MALDSIQRIIEQFNSIFNMDITAYYLRKKFWVNDFLHGGDMWKAFKEINYINANLSGGVKN